MRQESYRRDKIASAYKALSPQQQASFGYLFVQTAAASNNASALDLYGSSWLSIAEQVLGQLRGEASQISNEATSTAPMGIRTSIRNGMAQVFPRSVEFALEPWATREKDKLEGAIWLKLFQHRQSVETLIRDAPGMIPVWFWFSLRYPELADEEPLQALSQKISSAIRPASWRRLLRIPWPVLLRYCPAKPDCKFDQLIDFLEFINAIELPSVEHAERFICLHDALTSAGCQVFNAQNIDRFLPLPWIRELLTTSHDQLISEVGIYTVVCWYRDSGEASFDANCHVSWRKLYEVARSWAREKALILAARDCRWESDVDTFTIGNFKVVPLTSEASLIEEGCRMNHCVANYTDDCANGDYRIFSVRLASSGKRLATFSITYDPDEGWSVGMVNGYANAQAPQPIHNLAYFVAYAYDKY